MLVSTAACSAPATSAAAASASSAIPVASAVLPATGTPSVTPASSAAGGATAASVEHDPGRVSLPWPAATPAQAAALQRTVDGGAQPWLLDPTEVAQAYTRAVGWSNAQISTGHGVSPTLATVRSPAGSRTLTLRQPVRPGAGGIWLVTVDSAP